MMTMAQGTERNGTRPQRGKLCAVVVVVIFVRKRPRRTVSRSVGRARCNNGENYVKYDGVSERSSVAKPHNCLGTYEENDEFPFLSFSCVTFLLH